MHEKDHATKIDVTAFLKFMLIVASVNADGFWKYFNKKGSAEFLIELENAYIGRLDVEGNAATILHYLARWENSEPFEEFVKAGADMLNKDANGDTPLMYAASEFRKKQMKLCIAKKAYIENMIYKLYEDFLAFKYLNRGRKYKDKKVAIDSILCLLDETIDDAAKKSELVLETGGKLFSDSYGIEDREMLQESFKQLLKNDPTLKQEVNLKLYLSLIRSKQEIKYKMVTWIFLLLPFRGLSAEVCK